MQQTKIIMTVFTFRIFIVTIISFMKSLSKVKYIYLYDYVFTITRNAVVVKHLLTIKTC